MARSPLTVAGLRKLMNEMEEVCFEACNRGFPCEAHAKLELNGDYTMQKDGDIGLDVEIRADVPDSVPVEVGAKEGFGKEWSKSGDGQLSLLFELTMRNSK